MEHTLYDKRNYPIVDVQEGYGEWSRTYEQVVLDEMDVRLFEKITTVDWLGARRVLDLACGTGRIGVWLRRRCPNATLDGLDLTPQMLEGARNKGVYQNLYQGDVTQTGLAEEGYDLCTQSLADEHLPALQPLYQEAARLTRENGYFVLVGFHPQFLMAGVPTHFDRQPGQPVTIRSYVHLLSDHVKAALASGWVLQEMDEGLIDEAWLQKKPKWAAYEGLPISFAMVWQRG